MLSKLKGKKGFTLIEMLVVIAIIAVLVAIIVPVVSNATTKAKAATNAANLRSVAAEITIAIANDTIKPGATGAITAEQLTDANITTPTSKAVTGVTGGAFTAKVENGQVVCTFGDDGTIASYAKIAETGSLT